MRASVLALLIIGCTRVPSSVPSGTLAPVPSWKEEPLENRQYECSEVLFRLVKIILQERAFWRGFRFTYKQLSIETEHQIALMNANGESESFIHFCENASDRSELECAMKAGSKHDIQTCMHMD